jgi:hypothetical protein
MIQMIPYRYANRDTERVRKIRRTQNIMLLCAIAENPL